MRSAHTTAARPRLPEARGVLSQSLFDALSFGPGALSASPRVDGDPLTDDDFHLALYCAYELHYRGFEGVSGHWEWDPSLLAFRASLEQAFESSLRRNQESWMVSDEEAVAELWHMAAGDGGPSLSQWLIDHGTIEHARELAVHRSAYQLKEADPHTWGIPRLVGQAKAAMVAIQFDEYGNGDETAMHSVLFGQTMEALGLHAAYGAYLDLLPGTTLATTNLISMFGLHRRLLGALVGHLALFEMTSIGPMGRYSQWLSALGIDAIGRRFYDVHVEADAVHQFVASSDLVGGLLAGEPGLAPDVLFGAKSLTLVETNFSNRLRQAWNSGSSALLAPLPGPQRPTARSS
jgi:hypothetical protein